MKIGKMALPIIIGLLMFVAFITGCGEVDFSPQAIRCTRFRCVEVEHDLDVDGILYADALEFDETLDVDGAVTLNSTLDVDGGTTLNSTLDVDGGTTLNSTLDVAGGDIILANDETISNATDGLILLGGGVQYNEATITDTQTITPNGYSFYTVNSTAGTVLTMTACSSTGQVVYFYGADANTITMTTNILSTDGNDVVFDQYDIVGLMCTPSTEWALMLESNLQ